LIMVVLWLAVTGCSSIYYRTQKALPPEPGAELSLRVDEARRAENLLTQAGHRLRDDLDRRAPGESIQTDLDRVQMAALDLQRRTQAARDAASSANGHPEQADAIERLHLRSVAWLEFVQAARKADPAAQVARLDELLHSLAVPAPSATR
jgi:hypothetical protein